MKFNPAYLNNIALVFSPGLSLDKTHQQIQYVTTDTFFLFFRMKSNMNFMTYERAVA